MPNTILTPSIIAREALMALQNNLVMPRLVTRRYTTEFRQVGDTIGVRKPSVFTSQVWGGSTSDQYIGETNVSVKMDTILDVTVPVTSKEMTLSITDLRAQLLDPIMRAHAQKVDDLLCGLYVKTPYYYGTAGTTPDGLEDIAGVRKVLNVNKAPQDALRHLVVDPEADAKFGPLIQVMKAAASDGSGTDALEMATLGRISGFQVVSDQNVKAHTKGTLESGATGSGTAGSTSLTIASGGNAKTLKEGDIISIVGASGTYVCTATVTTSAGGAATAVLYPALSDTVSGAAITVLGSHTANLAFHEGALVLATAPMEPPAGGATSEVLTDPDTGLSVRVIYSWDNSAKTNRISIDMLLGVTCVYPELMARLIG